MPGLKAVFAAEFRRHRRRLGLTQAALAEKLELSVDMIGRLERGTVAPSFDTIERIAAAFRIDPAVLFGAPDPSEAEPHAKAMKVLISRLKGLSSAELAWLDRLIGMALSRPRGNSS